MYYRSGCLFLAGRLQLLQDTNGSTIFFKILKTHYVFYFIVYMFLSQSQQSLRMLYCGIWFRGSITFIVFFSFLTLPKMIKLEEVILFHKNKTTRIQLELEPKLWRCVDDAAP